jgi:hypothetical protein
MEHLFGAGVRKWIHVYHSCITLALQPDRGSAVNIMGPTGSAVLAHITLTLAHPLTAASKTSCPHLP